ncbi:hypothetical protein ACWEK5_45440 [Rhodococcus koreensis]
MDDNGTNTLVGRKTPGGEFSIAKHENWLAHDALYSPPREVPHPIVAFIGAQRGMGLSVEELFKLLESDIEDGPVLAQTTLELTRRLEVDVTYEVSGEVLDVKHKHGKAMGHFDLVTCRFELRHHDEDDVVATVTNVYAIGRDAA